MRETDSGFYVQSIAGRSTVIETFLCHTTAELPDIARKLIHKHARRRVFTLCGQMGAGKTTFMQAIARVLGCKDRVSSPTFGLIHEYESETAGCIYHFDFYRIQTFKEAVETGFDEYVNSGCYCFIEWADVIADALPEDAVKVIIVVNEDNRSRIFRF